MSEPTTKDQRAIMQPEILRQIRKLEMRRRWSSQEVHRSSVRDHLADLRFTRDLIADLGRAEEALLEARNRLDSCAAEGLRAASGAEAADAALRGAP